MEKSYQDQVQYIRELAAKVSEIARSHKNAEIRKRWCDVNALRRPDRAPVWCRPVSAWRELLPQDTMICTDPWLRRIEQDFRQTLIKHDIDDDTPLEPYFPVSAKFDITPSNIWGVDIQKTHSDEVGGSWGYNPPLKTAEDFEKLVLPRFDYNAAKTQEALDRATELLGDILPVQLVCHPPLSGILGTPAADLRGLTEMMMDTMLEPELLHRLMAYLRDAVLGAMRQVEETGLLTPNNNGPMTCSDFVGPAPENGKITYKNCWAMVNSQEFDQVSPEMWEEFCLNYQKPILEQFGFVGYGCCENLTHKMEGVLSIPNLRIFVCSAWTNLDRVIDRVGKNYVIMWRQKASDVVFPDDIGKIRHDLEEGMKKLQGHHVQVVLRELETLANHPDRLHVWTRLAKEAAAKYL